LDQSSFSGIWPALLTPLFPDGKIDLEKFAKHAKNLLDQGAAGITPFGTTGEGPSFSVNERRLALEHLIHSGIDSRKIIVGTFATSISDVIELTSHACNHRVHGCLVMPPFFFKNLRDSGVSNFFSNVIDSVNSPYLKIYLYHIPQINLAPITASSIKLLLAKYPNTFLGIKDSSCDREHSTNLYRQFGSEIQVYVGNELDLRVLSRIGSSGAISGLANFWPSQIQRLVKMPDDQRSETDEVMVKEFLNSLDGYELIPALKALMAHLTGDPHWRKVRDPLVELDQKECAHLISKWESVLPAQ
jgi:4-hydroxy-tetrahydrodipicolinate synthase